MREENEEKEKEKEKGKKEAPEGVNTPTFGSRMSSTSVKPASKRLRGAGSIKRFGSSFMVGVPTIAHRACV
jgi:hypothetical protein